ncbi:Sir2 family NAD-dependent protein deacetylase [Gilvibacter sediminis]|uniref:Sir2 family NAD-dependent protein deacetylase n=1 Tax=Gilvibacter sediminis TaxID=379071 RepID=UPI002350D809|nr:Sir2 family NAD-dependent protein deacetylase [Gilvibacter sediminis]MDC7999067.1 NAD-dependent deacylase [Gilvibacter sediminis]
MKITVLSGAGISAESGLKTFRDSNGLWEGHDVMEVASPQGWRANPELVLDFYNQRRRQLLEVEPNTAHKALAALEASHEVDIITQNVDDLHERGGSSMVMHLHGELLKVRCSKYHDDIKLWKKDVNLGDLSKNGHQLRPHIVWFGEDVPLIPKAVEMVSRCEALIIVGTSMQVYPAAGLLNYAPVDTPIFFVDPNPAIASGGRIQVIDQTATKGIPTVVDLLS